MLVKQLSNICSLYLGKQNYRKYPGLVCIALIVAAGCSGAPADQPELGLVSGTVTLDGQPLPEAYVTFTPKKGRSSSGITDGAGHYELFYTGDTKGAMIGRHKVDIRTIPDGDPNVAAEKVPAKYNTETELEVAVDPLPNERNFDLKSK